MIVFLTLIAYIGVANAGELPWDIKKCHFGQGDCIKNSINEVIRRYPKGIPELGMAPFDEFRGESLQLFDAPNIGSMWMKFKLFDAVLTGMENATVTHVSGFEYDPTKSKLEIRLYVPRMVLRSQYEMQKRWLSMVQTNTTGPCYAEFLNVSLTLNLRVVVKYQRDKRYLKIYDLSPRVDLGRLKLELSDMYKDNMDLTIAVNKVHNEYWVEIWSEIEPKVLPPCSRQGAQLLNRIFETISYDDMFEKS